MINVARLIHIFHCELGRRLCALVNVSEKSLTADFLNIGESYWRCFLPLGVHNGQAETVDNCFDANLPYGIRVLVCAILQGR